MRLTRLLPEDEPALRVWMRRFLHEHLRWWSEAYGLGWSEAAIAGHILGHDLVERDWQGLLAAARAYDDHFVAVAREGDRPLGAVWARTDTHAYLRVEIGVISWLYVTPEARGAGAGGVLVDEALGWMRSRGLRRAELFVVAGNGAAVRTYERAGLQIIDHRMGGPLDPGP